MAADVRNAPRLRLTHHRRNGHAVFRDTRVVLVASRFNESLTQALVEAASKTLVTHGVARAHLRTFWVPGAFELPVAAASVATRLRPDAIVALGCVIKGQTPQYAAIGHATAEGLVQVSVTTHIPVTFGVIIADSLAQAKARAGLPAPRRRGEKRRVRQARQAGNRGREAALAALAMVDLLREFPQEHRLV